MPLPWTASMISPNEDVTGAPLLRRKVTLDPGHGEVFSAWLHASSLGVIEAFVDGVPAPLVAAPARAEHVRTTQAPPDRPFESRAHSGVVATACAYRTARIVAESAALTGREDDAARFRALAGRLRLAFNEHYVLADGTITSDAPTVYALAVAFDLLDEADRSRAGDRLAELVAANGYHVGTGFAGTPFVTDALTDTGHLDAAYRLLLERTCPSWLYPVTMGATTVWERWDSMLPDGTINPGEMTSFNHYALGAVVGLDAPHHRRHRAARARVRASPAGPEARGRDHRGRRPASRRRTGW